MDRTALGGSSHGGEPGNEACEERGERGDAGAAVGSEGIFTPEKLRRHGQYLSRPAFCRYNFWTFLNVADELVGPATTDRKLTPVPFTRLAWG